jgi:hypothetical protein
MLERYAPSNRFSPSVFLLVPALIAAAAALAKVYQLAIYWIPLIYVNVLVTVAFGGALFYATREAMRVSKCRSTFIGTLIGIVVGAAGFAAAHYFDYRTNTSHVSGTVPFLDYVRWRLDNGWSIGRSGSPVAGLAVVGVWLIEAAIIIGAAALGGASTSREPFCEACGLWADKTIAAFQVQAPAEATVERIRRATSLADLTSTQGWGQGDAQTRLTYNVLGCAGCEDFNVLTITLHVDVTNRKGEVQTRNTELHKHLLLSLEAAAKVAVMVVEAEAHESAEEDQAVAASEAADEAIGSEERMA